MTLRLNYNQYMGKSQIACKDNSAVKEKMRSKIYWEALTHFSKNMSTRVPERITPFIAIEFKQLQVTVTFQWPRHIPEYSVHLRYQTTSC